MPRQKMKRLAVLVAVALAIPAIGRAQSTTAPRFVVTPETGVDTGTVTVSPWPGVLRDSLRLLVLEHGIRVAFQAKTRRELGGPFMRDYVRSLRVPSTWEDGDSWGVNYVGHPIHGAAASRIWIEHDRRGRQLELSLSRAYWASRGKAAAWGAVYSMQFEFGPVSEASIGNVGLRPGTTGWVDHVVTPAGAFAFAIAEDALDRYLIQFVERRTRNVFFRASVRMLFAPSWTMSNVAMGRTPWHRSSRPIR